MVSVGVRLSPGPSMMGVWICTIASGGWSPQVPTVIVVSSVAKSPVLSEFAELYDQYFPKVFAYVYGRVQDKEVSFDIVSDVFEKAYIKQKSLRSADSFGSWLFTIARNEVSSHWRKEKPAAKAAQEAAWEKEIHHQHHTRQGEDENLRHYRNQCRRLKLHGSVPGR